ncbi:MAG: sigma-70 family RNA polymerase sigma factor [Elusimicrobia bacterium]|nr:sigma-70 family RNA polymerase sigma factor [Elusimicrobiota bacterium]
MGSIPEKAEEIAARPEADAPASPLDGTPPAPAVSNPASEKGALSEALLLEHSAMVYNLALRLTGNAQDAEDLAQDALLRALKALAKFRGDCQASTWLYRITVNTWKNRVRAEKRRGLWKRVTLGLFTGDDEDEASIEDMPSEEAPPDAGLEAADSAASVRKALMDLEAESRAVIVLRDIEGQSYEEIALSLGVPEGTVKSRLSRARAALKGRLKRYL